MARTPATHNDEQITRMLKAGNSVAAIAAKLNVSEPTIYNAIRRLRLTIPSKSTGHGSAAATRRGATDTALTTQARTKSDSGVRPRVKPPAATTDGEPSKATTTKRAAARKRGSASIRPVSAAGAPPAESAAATSKQATPGTGLVPIGPATDLLTVRVDKGIELLKNLSARIVRHERELAAARQRYAETLAALALE